MRWGAGGGERECLGRVREGVMGRESDERKHWPASRSDGGRLLARTARARLSLLGLTALTLAGLRLPLAWD